MASLSKIAKIIIALTTISAAIMELIDTSIVNVALPVMGPILHLSFTGRIGGSIVGLQAQLHQRRRVIRSAEGQAQQKGLFIEPDGTL
ncbi:MAG: hypothetical protein HGB05_21005 [Chloroflexi bacterium]|nr:hypothetical protein [Chloroflexota bacterium]